MIGRTLWNWAPMPRLRREMGDTGLFEHGLIVAARAPGRLDVMGGIADYSGSLVCEMPLAVATGVLVQSRRDGMVVAASRQMGRAVELPAETIAPLEAEELRRLLSGPDTWARYAVGCWWWLVKHGALKGGAKRPRDLAVSLLVDSTVPLGGAVSSSAALEVASMTALAELFEVELKPMELAAACQYVENHVAGAPCGVMDQVTAALGEPGAMLEILCQPDEEGLPAQILGTVPVPKEYAFVGIYSGVSHDVSGDPYTDTRVASFMGQKILSTLEDPDPTQGWLARVDAERYRRVWREQLPEQMSGQEFLEKYGGTNDPVTEVVPEKVYRVRAATDHHVFEMQRVKRFVELVKAAQGPEARKCMIEAGRLMYESHDSYGRCANLGHPMTDLLVEMIRDLGEELGFYGAKITGGGSGGTIAVLMDNTDQHRHYLQEVCLKYESRTGKRTLYFEGTSPGALVLGAARWSY